MADAQQNQGFTIPPANTAPQPAPQPASQTPSTGAPAQLPNFASTMPSVEPEGPQSRDYAIGGGVLLVLLIAFFFAKNAYANHLASKRVAPGAANAAGWWLFIFLTSLSTASVLAVVNSAKFLSLVFMAPMGIVSIVALFFMLTNSRR